MNEAENLYEMLKKVTGAKGVLFQQGSRKGI